MIKIIDITGFAWNKHLLDENNDQKTTHDRELTWYESPVLEKFINEGWNIKDWKMCKSQNGTDWTFILEK